MRTMRIVLGAAIVTAGMLATTQAAAHHSFAAEFDANKPITLSGTITKMIWSNPHSWLYIDVKGPDGTVKNWALEFGGPNMLYRRGWRKTDLPVGVQVTMSGFLAKDGSTTANVVNVTMSDGRQLFAGSAVESGRSKSNDGR